MLILAVVFFLLGGPLCLRSVGDTAFVPGGQTLSTLVDQAIFGWKDLLTTLPPVDGDGPLLVLPWLLGPARRPPGDLARRTCTCGGRG